MIKGTEDLRWVRSTKCASGNCVEVARDGDHVLLRDSKRPDGIPFEFTREEWKAFVAGVKADEFSF
jgi:hypothetical protein